jgi:hypothetical protein
MEALPVADTALWRWLSKHSPGHAARLAELRSASAVLLGDIRRTFPHYPDHAVDHSDEIIRQASLFLFSGDATPRQIVKFSPAEALIIGSAAYLHDIGMVVPERERSTIHSSDHWKAWLATRPDLETDPGTTAADHAYAFAEYIRVQHASRSAALLEPDSALAGLLPDDAIFRRTIADVCKSHAREAADLRNRDEYPDQVDILNDKVNVAFCSVVLRLADLLDTRESRSSRLLWHLAFPVAEPSRSHWEAFRCLRRRNTTSHTIQMTAACETADQHRVLRNWFQWIADETENASVMARRWSRHQHWSPPHASVGKHDSTLILDRQRVFAPGRRNPQTRRLAQASWPGGVASLEAMACFSRVAPLVS